MEIAPIPGIRVIAANRVPRPNTEISPASDIDPLSKMRDGSAGASGDNAAGAEDNDDLDLAEEGEDEAAKNSSGVNYFA